LKHIDFSLLDKHKPALVISTGAVPLTAMALSRFPRAAARAVNASIVLFKFE